MSEQLKVFKNESMTQSPPAEACTLSFPLITNDGTTQAVVKEMILEVPQALYRDIVDVRLMQSGIMVEKLNHGRTHMEGFHIVGINEIFRLEVDMAALDGGAADNPPLEINAFVSGVTITGVYNA